MEPHDESPVHSLMSVVDDYMFLPDAALVPYSFKLCVADGEYTIATWQPHWPMAHDDYIDIARVTLIPCAIDRDIHWVATRIDYEPEAPIIDLIPETLGNDDTIVLRFRELVGGIDNLPLAELINRIWKLRTVFRNFWTCPASQGHHHAYRGGLASHSIAMAERVAQTPALKGTDRDIGVTYALLHDLGKLWCYGERGHEPMAQLGHELVGLARLNSALDVLHHEWPDGAVAVRSLLSGLWKTKGQKPLLAIGKLVQAYDQMSAEEDLRGRAGHRHQPWAVKTYSDNVRPFPKRT